MDFETVYRNMLAAPAMACVLALPANAVPEDRTSVLWHYPYRLTLTTESGSSWRARLILEGYSIAMPLRFFVRGDKLDKNKFTPPERIPEPDTKAWEAKLGFVPYRAFVSHIGRVAAVGTSPAVVIFGRGGTVLREYRLADLLKGEELRHAHMRVAMGRPWCISAGFAVPGRLERSLTRPIRRGGGHTIWQGTVFSLGADGFACALVSGSVLWFDSSDGEFLGKTGRLPSESQGLVRLGPPRTLRNRPNVRRFRR